MTDNADEFWSEGYSAGTTDARAECKAEIERLQRQVEHFHQDMLHEAERVYAAKADTERLQERLKVAETWWDQCIAKQEEIERLQGEIERLRDELYNAAG